MRLGKKSPNVWWGVFLKGYVAWKWCMTLFEAPITGKSCHLPCVLDNEPSLFGEEPWLYLGRLSGQRRMSVVVGQWWWDSGCGLHSKEPLEGGATLTLHFPGVKCWQTPPDTYSFGAVVGICQQLLNLHTLKLVLPAKRQIIFVTDRGGVLKKQTNIPLKPEGFLPILLEKTRLLPCSIFSSMKVKRNWSHGNANKDIVSFCNITTAAVMLPTTAKEKLEMTEHV